ncbi:hypothetical protein [Ornithobacterium rhinotracheale]|uniref:hypothetical protein n=1 Tax=Ornithobacterium rhinotracheale TaxID=28251 RepID=UPI0040350D3B
MKTKKLLPLLLGLFLTSCFNEDISDLKTIKESIKNEISQISYEITPDVETPLKRKIKELAIASKRGNSTQKFSMFSKTRRSDNFSMRAFPLNPDEETQHRKSLLDANFFNLEGELYAISPAYSGNLYLYSLGVNKLSGFKNISNLSKSKDEKATFKIKTLPSVIGFSNLIESSIGEKIYLSSGKYQKTQNIAYLRDFSRESSIWGSGWNIEPIQNGYFSIKSADAFEYIPPKNGEGIGVTHPLVIQKSSPKNNLRNDFNENLCCLMREDPSNSNQSMKIIPLSEYTFRGVRFFGKMGDFQSNFYERNAPQDSSFFVISKSQVDEEDYGYNQITIKEVKTITSERSYTNSTDKDVEYDMVFDDVIDVKSNFYEFKGLSFNWDKNTTKIPIPYMRNGDVFSSSVPVVWSSSYNGYSSKRKLQGELPLLISPKTKVTLTYKYVVYEITVPYIIYLESPLKQEDGSHAIAKIAGKWTGNVVAQDLKGEHHYKREKEETDEIDFGIIDDDEIDFSSYSTGYSTRYRTFNHKKKKRIRL